jgi:hypothetical protein
MGGCQRPLERLRIGCCGLQPWRLGGMYGAKWQALAKEHEQGRPDKR